MTDLINGSLFRKQLRPVEAWAEKKKGISNLPCC
jgi:hypothetical protein